MKCQVPQISWHGRDPVLSIDFQPNHTDVLRLARAGQDSHILMWYITYQENKSIKLECASDLYRHNKSVNVVRFSPSGEFLASGDDEGTMFIWMLKEQEQVLDPTNEDENVNKEDWYPVKMLRGHLDDIYDICWSKDGNLLVSSSMDNTAVIWDTQKFQKVHIFTDFKGYVQGVCWDPCNQFIASVGSDRTLRIHNINTKKIVHRITKAPWTNSTEKGTFKARLFYDDTLQSYFRRLTFTPDGELLIVPSGIVEKGDKITNSCHIFSRHALNKPVITLPTADKYTVAVKCNPFLYKLRGNEDQSNKENETVKSMINLPYRMIFAVAACDSVLFYDTEQLLPFAFVSNIHYTHLTDLSWSPDGLTLIASSTDGYCSFILFSREELGEIYTPPEPEKVEKEPEQVVEKDKDEKMDVQSNTVIQVENENKVDSTPNTPKNAGSSTPKVVSEKKPTKKSPKLCSIKNFFKSPKTTLPALEETYKKQPSLEKNKAEPIEIVLSDSPLKPEKVSSKTIINEDKSCTVEAGSRGKEAMDVEDSPIQIVSKDNLQQSPNSTGKQSKCKIRLDFTNKDSFVAAIDDNASDSNNTSENIDKLSSEPIVIKESENDWKLELSQDDDTPMEVSPSVPDKNTEASVSFDLNSKVQKPKTAVPQITASENEKASESKPVTKRRVAFVTLSSKPTFKK